MAGLVRFLVNTAMVILPSAAFVPAENKVVAPVMTAINKRRIVISVGQSHNIFLR